MPSATSWREVRTEATAGATASPSAARSRSWKRRKSRGANGRQEGISSVASFESELRAIRLKPKTGGRAGAAGGPAQGLETGENGTGGVARGAGGDEPSGRELLDRDDQRVQPRTNDREPGDEPVMTIRGAADADRRRRRQDEVDAEDGGDQRRVADVDRSFVEGDEPDALLTRSSSDRRRASLFPARGVECRLRGERRRASRRRAASGTIACYGGSGQPG